MLEVVDIVLRGWSVCDWCVLHGLRQCVQQQQRAGDQTDIIQNIK